MSDKLNEMLTWILSLTAGLVLVLSFQNCGEMNAFRVETQSGLSLNPTFNELNSKIFKNQCLSCHGAGSSPDFSSYSALISGTSIVASDPNSSSLYLRVANHTMPPDKPLNEDHIQALYAWISNGAPENDFISPDPNATLPQAPSNALAVTASSAQINLSWTDNSGNETGFVIERSNNASGPFFLLRGVTANTTSIADLGLTSSTTYYYRVYAQNDLGSSSPSNVSGATTMAPSPVPPGAPNGLASAVVSPTRINLTWVDNSSDESGFYIERSLNGTAFTQVGAVGAGVTDYSDSTLSASTTYHFRVRAFNSAGASSYSNSVQATTQTAPTLPMAPTGLNLTVISSSQINLSWTDSSENENGFYIDRSVDGTSFSQIGMVGSGVTTYSSTGLSPSTAYHYRVRAFNAAGNSAYSNIRNATTQAPPVTIPAVPSGLSATSASTSQINLSWTDNSSNESGFYIERSSNGTNYTQIATVTANTTTYMNGALSPATTYYYRTRAYNSAGSSNPSNAVMQATQSPPPPPNAPSGLTATATSSSQIILSWADNSSNETGFFIERSLDGSSFSQIASATTNATSYANTGLSASTRYHYRVRAYSANGNSLYSATATAQTSASSGGSGNWSPRNSARIFFSGHSLLDNPLPDHVAEIASRRSDDLRWNQQNVSGSPIRIRSKGGNFNSSAWPGYSAGKNRSGDNMNVINEFLNPQTIGTGNRYDTLVLTERHDVLTAIRWEDTVGLTRHYHDRFIAGNPSGKTYFYHSWYDINKNDPSAFIAHEKNAQFTWECAVSKVNLTLESDGRSDRLILLPAGGALVDLVERIMANQVPGITGSTSAKLNQIFSDNVHLTNLGAYYMGLVVYSATFGKSPEGTAAPSGLNSQTVAAMQEIAWNHVNAYYNRQNPGLRSMAECREHTRQYTCTSFFNYINEPENISGCQNWWGSATQSVFRWPDSNYTPWPAP